MTTRTKNVKDPYLDYIRVTTKKERKKINWTRICDRLIVLVAMSYIVLWIGYMAMFAPQLLGGTPCI